MSRNQSLRHRSWYERIVLFFAFGLGSGLLRPAPGTWGTLPGVLLAYWVMTIPVLHWAVLAMTIVAGIWLCDKASNILGVHDFDGIVIDEIAGVLIAFLYFEPNWLTLLLGFAWFRFFDILKPWPVKWADQNVSGGVGIMLDDIIAGILAWFALYFSLKTLYAIGLSVV